MANDFNFTDKEKLAMIFSHIETQYNYHQKKWDDAKEKDVRTGVAPAAAALVRDRLSKAAATASINYTTVSGILNGSDFPFCEKRLLPERKAVAAMFKLTNEKLESCESVIEYKVKNKRYSQAGQEQSYRKGISWVLDLLASYSPEDPTL